MSEAEFDGRDYAVGTVRGVRAFDVDKYGRLRGVTHRDIWAPGENTAVCHNKRPADGWQPAPALYTVRGGITYTHPGHGGYTHNPPMQPVIERPHTLAECSHGFYAYYDGSNDYQKGARISAVIEAYGEVLIGTRGFRAEKARLVALCIPDDSVSDEDGSRLQRLKRWTPRIIWSVATGGQMGAATFMWLHGSWFNGVWSTLAAAAMFYITGWRTKWIYKPEPITAPSIRALRLKYEGLSDETISPKVFDAVRRNYPDVPIYTSFQQMVTDNPPDKGLTPSPENDPNFWSNR